MRRSKKHNRECEILVDSILFEKESSMKKVLFLFVGLSLMSCSNAEDEAKSLKLATPQPPVVVNKAEVKKEKEVGGVEVNKEGNAKGGIWDNKKEFKSDADLLNY